MMAIRRGAAGSFPKPKTLKGFIAELKDFGQHVLPQQFVDFQKWIALQLYKLILEKTPVDKGMLRGSWTVTVGAQDKTPANKKTSAPAFETAYGGSEITPEEQANLDAGLRQMSDLHIGQIIWFNNAMPYVLRIEFDGHSSVKAPDGMVQISINELKSFLKTTQSDFLAIKKRKGT